MPTHRILLVAYHFPPIAGSGVQRALKLAKYLPDHRVRVHVLTVGHTHYPLLDDSLLDEIRHDPRVQVHRVHGFEPGGLANRMVPRWKHGAMGTALSAVERRVYWRLQSAADRWAMPEPERWWIGSAVRAARRLHDKHRFDAVITTSPPHSCQQVGIALRRDLNIPWIADLRDPIVDNFAYAPKREAADRHWKTLERDVVTHADTVVVTCPDYSDLLTRKYNGDSPRIACITNGYDEADRPATTSPPDGDRFVLAHVGAFYQSQSIGPLLEACRDLRSRGVCKELALRLVGSVSRQQEVLFTATDSAFVTRAGYRHHAEALVEMGNADALFLMTPTHANGRNCIPAKLFEYLAFGRRIVALVHRDSSVDRLLRDSGVREIAYHDDNASLAMCIENAHREWVTGAHRTDLNASVVEQYRRDRLAARYAEIITSTIDSRGASQAEVGGAA